MGWDCCDTAALAIVQGMRLGDLDPGHSLRDPREKQRYVRVLFDTVAPRYDRFTRWFSFGMDRWWKRRLARWAAAALPDGGRGVLLDLACGTGDLGRAVRRMDGRPAALIGLDSSREMLRLAARRATGSVTDGGAAGPAARLVRGDMMAIPLPARSVDVITVGYGFRNTPDAKGAFAEAARVLKPGGWLLDLDFFRPEGRLWRRLYLWYLRGAGWLVGRLWHGEPETYGYIARSIERWLTPAEFRSALASAGFAVERCARRLGGGICVHAARRTGS
jgi:demethylmenaquinone methyltransferase/2-methoxy-6-polyprenyl-1,4-benzoquinol methylase